MTTLDKRGLRQQFRDQALARDGHRCRVSGAAGALDVHHITDRSLMPAGGYVVSNAITLAEDVHAEAERHHASGGQDWAEGLRPDDLYALIASSREQALADAWDLQARLAEARLRDLQKAWPSPPTLDRAAGADGCDLDAAELLLPELARTRGVPQDPRFHAEGDVFTHTLKVLDELVRDPAFACLPPQRRQRLRLAALLHDVGKVSTTRLQPDDTISSHGHARRGALDARVRLYKLGVDPVEREAVAALVANHMRPYRLLDRDTPEVLLDRMSWELHLDDLAFLARADARGRATRDPADLQDGIDRIELFEAFLDERGLRHQPQTVVDAGARLAYLEGDGHYPLDLPKPAPQGAHLRLVCGLPGSGKDTWLATHHPELPVVSLDALRAEMGISATDKSGQGTIVQAAKERARAHLRAGTAFAWNATNLSREQRGQVIELARAYDAFVEIVHLEAPYTELRRRNRARAAGLPEAAIERMLRRWEPPAAYEAHRVQHVCPQA